MRVLFLDQYSDLGGAQQCLLSLLPAFRDAGCSCLVAAPGPGQLQEAAAGAGAGVAVLPDAPLTSGRKTARDLARFARLLPQQARAIGNLVATYRPSLLYVNGPRLLPAAAWQSQRRCPVLFHSHHYLGKRYATQLAARAIARLEAAVAGCCEFVTAQWRPYVPAPRLHTVYNGVPSLPFRARTSGTPRAVGIVGRISREKGQHLFLEMARLLAPSHPGLEFLIAGEPLFGDREAARYREELTAAARGLPVRFLGWQTGLGSLYASLDLIVVPPTVPEATTRVIPEAWSAGTLVVAADSGGIAEIVRNGENGFLVEQPTPERLAERVEEALSLAPARWTAIASAARDSYQRNFTVERYCSRILSICSRL